MRSEHTLNYYQDLSTQENLSKTCSLQQVKRNLKLQNFLELGILEKMGLACKPAVLGHRKEIRKLFNTHSTDMT